MPPAQSSDLKFEIGHVLFIDIVGDSKLLNTEQSEHIQKLREIVNPVRWRTGWKRPAHSTLLWLDPDFRSASE
jgi:hypothetical protein